MCTENKLVDDSKIVHLVDFELLPDFQLFVTFEDGTKGFYDLQSDIETIPWFDNLWYDPFLYNQAKLEYDAICWNDEIYLDSFIIYEYLERI